MAGEFQLTEQEYRLFFALDELPASSRILDCAAGPSSFAAERAASGRPVIAADPLYADSAEEIWARIDGAAPAMAAGWSAPASVLSGISTLRSRPTCGIGCGRHGGGAKISARPPTAAGT